MPTSLMLITGAILTVVNGTHILVETPPVNSTPETQGQFMLTGLQHYCKKNFPVEKEDVQLNSIAKGIAEQVVQHNGKLQNYVASDYVVVDPIYATGIIRDKLSIESPMVNSFLNRCTARDQIDRVKAFMETNKIKISAAQCAVATDEDKLSIIMTIVLLTEKMAPCQAFLYHLEKVGKQKWKTIFNGIPPNPSACDFKTQKQNSQRNRYSNDVCVEVTRVELGKENNECRYINANYITGYNNKEKTYIATQAPIVAVENKTCTVPDFWEMVWQEKVATILMLTKLEKGKCEQYWPDVMETHGNFQVKKISAMETSITSLKITQFQISKIENKNQTDAPITVYHLWYTAWPDHSAVNVEEFLNLRTEVRKYQKLGTTTDSPLIVHCSAGIGRTGAYITADISVEQLANNEWVNADDNVKNIRNMRAECLEEDQFKFCNEVALFYANHIGLITKEQYSLAMQNLK